MHSGTTGLNKLIRLLSSLKLAIPLLIILTVATVIGSLFPQPDMFSSWWYLGLLGLLGLSLLLITILHIPALQKRRGRKAMIGVVATHAGILVLIAGVIYGQLSGLRFSIKTIEQQMTVVPGLPFVVYLDELLIEEYDEETFRHVRSDMVPRKKQESRITLLKNGSEYARVIVSPGHPATVDNFKILPALTDTGWVFELIVTDRMEREKTIEVKPWTPPVINIGELSLMAHGLMDSNEPSVQLFTLVDEEIQSFATIARGQDLDLDGNRVSLGEMRRYTGLYIYNRPHALILLLGCAMMMLGLLFHFYHRHN